ncbi:hypothetical protein Q7P37_002705 [Cladosporium fusiforme]
MPNHQNNPTTFFEDANILASLSTRPSTPGDTIIHIKAGPLSHFSKPQFIKILQSTKHAATIVKQATKAQRVALATTANNTIRLIPLHNLTSQWKPALDTQKEYHASYPGYVSSRSGPKSPNDVLDEFQRQITNGNIPARDTTCIAATPAAASNLFARILRGDVQEQWRVWESEMHVAFLTPFANSPGKTILVPRKHLGSDCLALPDEDFQALLDAVWDVMLIIRESDFGARRVGLIFEGMEVDWAHAKLIPIHGDGPLKGQGVGGQPFTKMYTGSVSSLPGPEVDLEELRDLLARFIAAAASDFSTV